jgi:hypothetical protein
LEGNPEEVSIALLDEVERQLADRNREVAWRWYFSSAYGVTLFCVASVVLLWLYRAPARSTIGQTAFEVFMGTLCGAVGALLSTTSRGNRLVLDANAGASVHRLEGLSRVGAGLIGALMVALSIKGGLLMSGTRFLGSRLAVLLAFCVAAGASERLVPSLVMNMERSVGQQPD